MKLILKDHENNNDEKSLQFRSRGLFVFLSLLKQAHPSWVDLNAVFQALPNTTPRQIARYIDLLESANLRLVEYKTKTKGQFRLGVAPQSLQLPELYLAHENYAHQKNLNATQSKAKKHLTQLSDYLTSDWLIWLQALLQSHLALMDGHLCAQKGALLHLHHALKATNKLPVWTKSVVFTRLVHAHTRRCEYAEAKKWLRKANTLKRSGLAHPALAQRLDLLSAKLSYDQGDYLGTQSILDSMPANLSLSPQQLNIQALLFGQKCLDDASHASAHLLEAFELLSQAIGGVFFWQEDTSILDALTYNFGNIMLRAVKLNILTSQHADLAAQWLASNITICRKLGVGEDSVLTDLLLFDLVSEYDIDYQSWPDCLKGRQFSTNKLHILQRAESHARAQHNLVELAECLCRLILIVNAEMAQTYHTEAKQILAIIKRPDIEKKLHDVFVQRFSG